MRAEELTGLTPEDVMTLKTEDLKSVTSVRTRLNTSRNRRTDSMSSAGSETCSRSLSVDDVEKCDCCAKAGRTGPKVRFVHPSANQVRIIGEHKVTFVEPKIPMSEEDRQRSREQGTLPGTAYQGMNTGTICANVPAHYARICDCRPKVSDDEEQEIAEEGAEFTFKYNGPVYYDEELYMSKSRRKGSKVSRVLGLADAEQESE